MSTQRKITLTLTDRQYAALGRAVETAAAELEQDTGSAERGRARALHAAWQAIQDAWHVRAHRDSKA